MHLERQGFTVWYAPLLKTGEIDIENTIKLVNDKTALLVFGLVNSDIGTLRDAKALVTAVKSKNKFAHVHCDAVQTFCKFDFNAENIGLDTVTVSAHKIGGPKGIGALWIKKGVSLCPLMYGGAHGMRPGTENNAAIAGFVAAVTALDIKSNLEKVTVLHRRLINGLPFGCSVNGINNNPYITNILLPNIYGETVLNALNAKNVFVGLGSACAINSAVNRTLRAVGLTPKQQKQVLRISFWINNTVDDVDIFLTELKDIINGCS
jgi:cysteine desulfurase